MSLIKEQFLKCPFLARTGQRTWQSTAQGRQMRRKRRLRPTRQQTQCLSGWLYDFKEFVTSDNELINKKLRLCNGEIPYKPLPPVHMTLTKKKENIGKPFE